MEYSAKDASRTSVWVDTALLGWLVAGATTSLGKHRRRGTKLLCFCHSRLRAGVVKALQVCASVATVCLLESRSNSKQMLAMSSGIWRQLCMEATRGASECCSFQAALWWKAARWNTKAAGRDLSWVSWSRLPIYLYQIQISQVSPVHSRFHESSSTTHEPATLPALMSIPR